MGMEDILGIGSAVTGAIPAITGLVDRFRAGNDPLMQLLQQNQMTRYTNAVTGQYNPYGDPYGGYGMYGQMGGQSLSPFQAQQFALSNMLNSQQNPMQAYQQNLAGLMQQQGPQMYNATAGMSNLLGSQQQMGMRQPGFNPAMPNLTNTGTNQTQQGRNITNTGAGYPGAGVQQTGRNGIQDLFNIGFQGYMPQYANPQAPGTQPERTGESSRTMRPQLATNTAAPQQRGMAAPQQNQTGAQMPLAGQPPMQRAMGIAPQANPQQGGFGQQAMPQQQQQQQNNVQTMLQNPYAQQSQLAPQTFNQISNQQVGQVGHNALNAQVGDPTNMSTLQRVADLPSQMTWDTVQRISAGMPQPGAMGALEGLAGQQGGVTQQALSNPQAQGPALLSALSQQAQGGTAGLMQQLQQNPMSMTQQVQDQIFNRDQETVDAATRDMQRQMRESAAASGNVNTGQFNENMYQSELDRIKTLGGLRRDIGIQAAQTNFNDLLNASGMQQQDLSRQFGQLQGATGMQQDVNQALFGNRLQTAGLEQSDLGRLYGQQYGLAGLQNQLGQQDIQNRLSGANLQQQNIQRQFGNQMDLAGFQNQLGQQGFQNLMGQAGLENQYGQQNLQNLMAGTQLEQGLNQQDWQNMFNTGQAQFGMEQALGQQQLAQNDQYYNQWMQNMMRQQGLAGELAGAGAGNEQRTQDLWSQLTGGAQRGLDYENALMNQIGNMQMWRLSPSPMTNTTFQMPQSNYGGGGGGDNNQLLMMLAQAAGGYLGGQ